MNTTLMEHTKLNKVYKEQYAPGGHIIIGNVGKQGITVKREADDIYRSIPAIVKDFMPIHQQKTVQANILEFQDVIERLEKIIKSMPKTYEQENTETNDKICYLHYFSSDSDWWVVEKDKGYEEDFSQKQAFGFALLHGDWHDAEWGYMNIEDELKRNSRVELDFHFEPVKFGEILKKHKQIESEENLEPQNKEEAVEIKEESKLTDSNEPIVKKTTIVNPHVGNIVSLKKEDGARDLYDYNRYYFIDDVIEMEETDILTKVKKPLIFCKLINKHTGQTLNRIERDRFYILDDFDLKHHLSNKLIDQIKGGSVAEPVTINELAIGKNQHEINELIRNIVKERGTERNKYSAQELQLLESYEGSGGLAKEGEKGTRLLDQFFTPDEIVAKMWGLAIKHGFNFEETNICEPSVGIGRFLKYIPEDTPDSVHTFEIDETSHAICKILYPKFTHNFKSFETLFVQGNRHVGLAGVTTFYDLIIGNPPYRKYVSQYAVLGERDATGADTFDQYFIMRGVDVLKKGGLLVFIIPSSFMNNKMAYNEFKENLAKKCDLIDAYRLPSGIFGNTDVTTDIIVLKKK